MPWSGLATSPVTLRSSGTFTEAAIGSGVRKHELRGAVDEAEEDLRSTAEAIARDAERLAAIEREKAILDPSDPRMIELSAEAEELARRLVPKTVAEAELASDRQG